MGLHVEILLFFLTFQDVLPSWYGVCYPFKMKCIDFSCLKYLLSNRSFSKPTVTNDYTNNESLQFETTATVMETGKRYLIS